MSYRTKVNGIQLFGNNEVYSEWIEFIKSQGITVDDENQYAGEVHDFMTMLEVVEKIVLNLEKERQTKREKVISEMTKRGFSQKEIQEALLMIYGVGSIFDFTDVPDTIESQKTDEFGFSLFDEIYRYTQEAYAFLPYSLYIACKDELDPMDLFSVKGHLHCYKIKDGKSIKVSAS